MDYLVPVGLWDGRRSRAWLSVTVKRKKRDGVFGEPVVYSGRAGLRSLPAKKTYRLSSRGSYFPYFWPRRAANRYSCERKIDRAAPTPNFPSSSYMQDHGGEPDVEARLLSVMRKPGVIRVRGSKQDDENLQRQRTAPREVAVGSHPSSDAPIPSGSYRLSEDARAGKWK